MGIGVGKKNPEVSPERKKHWTGAFLHEKLVYIQSQMTQTKTQYYKLL